MTSTPTFAEAFRAQRKPSYRSVAEYSDLIQSIDRGEVSIAFDPIKAVAVIHFSDGSTFEMDKSRVAG